MRSFVTSFKYRAGLFSSSLKRMLLVSSVAALACTYIIYQANAHSNGQGIGGLTNKAGNTTGCYCHCASSSSATTVTIATSSSAPYYTGQTYTFTVTVSNSTESGAGAEVSVKNGTLATANTSMQLISGELTHTSPKTSLPAVWTFSYTAPSSIPSSGYDTLFATGNAVNLDGMNGGGNCTDVWNFAPKFAIPISTPPVTKAIALSRTAIALGNVRVGTTKRDSFQILSTSTSAITVNSSMKSGTEFRRYPTGTNRSIAGGSVELDSAEFSPTARGSFSDSVVITSDVDNVSDQHKGVYLTGTGIAGIYSAASTSLAFNNLRTGLTRQLAFVYSNTGDDTLFMQTPSISGSGFTIVSGPTHLNLPPGASDSIVVQFAPTSKGSYTGTLTPAEVGQSLSAIPLSGTGVAPTIGFTSPQNIGGVRVNQSTQGTYTILNTGTDTLHISSASITGGATTKFSISTPPASVIAPQSQTSVLFNYAPTQEKFDTITFTINSDDPTTPTANALIVGQGLEPHILVDETDTVDFGAVKINSSGALMNISVQNTGSDILNVSTVSITPGLPFSLVSKTSAIIPNGAGNIGVQFSPTAVGEFTGSVTINSDDPQKPTQTVNVKGIGINSALSLPTSVDFQSITVSTEKDTTITLQNTGTAGVNVLKYTLTSPDGAFGILDTTAHTIGANSSITIKLKFLPTTAKTYSGSLAVLTDDLSAPTRMIALSGSGLQGSLSLSLSTLNFGSIDTLTSKVDTVTICNTGTASVTVDAINLTGGTNAFQATAAPALPFILAPSGCLSIAVTFDPQHSGTFSGSLSIHTKEVSSLSVALTGAGNPPKQGVAESALASGWSLSVNPNPSQGDSKLNITAPRSSQAEVTLYDATGRIVQKLFQGILPAGNQTIPMNLAALPTGSYFMRVISDNALVGESRIVLQH